MLNITTGNCGNSYPVIRRKRRPSTLIIPGEKKWKRWSPEEDQKLAEYVKNNGDKDWSHVHFETGLLKNRKSCRLRWKNYLDPNIKRGALNEDEEHLIIRLHNLVGNRWSIIAGRLSGRTDNDIKNYWYTKVIKKCLTIDELNCKMNTELEKFKKMEIPTFRPPSPINNLVNGDQEEEKLGLKSMYDLTKFLGLD